MSSSMKEIELLIRESTLKSVEVWLNEQYAEIAKEREAEQSIK